MSLARFALTPRFPTFWRDVDELFGPVAQQPATLTPAADILETDKTVELHLDMPGIAPEAIDVKVEGDQLTITAERKDEKNVEDKGWIRRERTRGTFTRSFTLNDTLDGTKPEATYRHGVLTVTLPKREAAQPRSLKVKVEA
ncbi:MAG: Hsp20/alpha crystallin family protein [Archangium sp.]|nr:Hsp20/alpha crystallin family protein [Archangium sp.]